LTISFIFFNIFTMLIHFYLFSSIFVYFGRFLSICNRFHPFPPHYRFLHDQVWRNGLPTLLKSLIRTVWAYSESQTAQILDWGYLRKNSFFAQNGRITIFQWPKVVSEVIFPRFWGGSLCWKVFLEFWNCDQKCRFWGIAILKIRAFKIFFENGAFLKKCFSFKWGTFWKRGIFLKWGIFWKMGHFFENGAFSFEN